MKIMGYPDLSCFGGALRLSDASLSLSRAFVTGIGEVGQIAYWLDSWESWVEDMIKSLA